MGVWAYSVLLFTFFHACLVFLTHYTAHPKSERTASLAPCNVLLNHIMTSPRTVYNPMPCASLVLMNYNLE